MNIEPLLTEHLRPVSAPPQLWARVLLPGEHRRGSHEVGRRLAWCLTAALIVLMAVWGFRARGAGSPPVLAKAPRSVPFAGTRALQGRAAAVDLALRVGDNDARACLRCHIVLN